MTDDYLVVDGRATAKQKNPLAAGSFWVIEKVRWPAVVENVRVRSKCDST